jgi:sugar/nucleoside kinase (ribokinase family)
MVRHVVDPIGAGDALLAHAVLALAVTDNIVVASILGSIGAAVTCERQGNSPVSPEAVLEKIEMLEREARYEVGSRA